MIHVSFVKTDGGSLRRVEAIGKHQISLRLVWVNVRAFVSIQIILVSYHVVPAYLVCTYYILTYMHTYHCLLHYIIEGGETLINIKTLLRQEIRKHPDLLSNFHLVVTLVLLVPKRTSLDKTTLLRLPELNKLMTSLNDNANC